MTKQIWTISGRLFFEPTMTEIRERYGALLPLSGARLQVSAKEYETDPKWQEWSDVSLCPGGRFTITERKDGAPRYFRIRVMFEDEEFRLYPAQDALLSKIVRSAASKTILMRLAGEFLENVLSGTARPADRVGWHTIYEAEGTEQRKDPGSVDFGDLVFRAQGDPEHQTARRQAEFWWFAKTMIEPLIGDEFEIAFANAENAIVHVMEKAGEGRSNARTPAETVTHARADRHSSGENRSGFAARHPRPYLGRSLKPELGPLPRSRRREGGEADLRRNPQQERDDLRRLRAEFAPGAVLSRKLKKFLRDELPRARPL